MAEQEIPHTLGRISGLSFDPSTWTVLDLYRYSSPGVFTHALGSAAYFSIDGGATNLGNLATGDPSVRARRSRESGPDPGPSSEATDRCGELFAPRAATV